MCPSFQAILDVGVFGEAEFPGLRVGLKGRGLEEVDAIGAKDFFGDPFKEGVLDQVD